MKNANIYQRPDLRKKLKEAELRELEQLSMIASTGLMRPTEYSRLKELTG